MTKLEIKLKYYDLIAHAGDATRHQLIECQNEIDRISDNERNEAIEKLDREQRGIKAFSDNLASEVFIVLTAYNDAEHPAHDFAVAYVEAVRNRLDCIEGKA